MNPALADAYRQLMDRAGPVAPSVLGELAHRLKRDETISITRLKRALSERGAAMSTGELRDVLMTLQPLLLRASPGTDAEQIGFRHPSIAAIAAVVTLRHRPATNDTTSTISHEEVLADMHLFIDNEMAAERRKLTQQHLDDCANCLRTFEMFEALKRTIAHGAGGDRAPDDLRRRITACVKRTPESLEPSPAEVAGKTHPNEH